MALVVCTYVVNSSATTGKLTGRFHVFSSFSRVAWFAVVKIKMAASLNQLVLQTVFHEFIVNDHVRKKVHRRILRIKLN